MQSGHHSYSTQWHCLQRQVGSIQVICHNICLFLLVWHQARKFQIQVTRLTQCLAGACVTFYIDLSRKDQFCDDGAGCSFTEPVTATYSKNMLNNPVALQNQPCRTQSRGKEVLDYQAVFPQLTLHSWLMVKLQVNVTDGDTKKKGINLNMRQKEWGPRSGTFRNK